MRRLAILALCSALTGMGSGIAAAEVQVTFVAPEHYTDASLYNGYGAAGRAPALRQIEQTLHRLGERYLRPSQRLSVDVLDVDLAGRFEPWRPQAFDVRLMREVTWPRIKLRYTLTEAGRPSRSGEEDVSDEMYLTRAGIRSSVDVMPYEKAMLERWFRARFAETPIASH
ncbi:MAG TPA: DUF3016 domain-containing protein [Stellaceae bacterium]|nr:DUF3016 domain-containing protein [Stellaceae bacterium]